MGGAMKPEHAARIAEFTTQRAKARTTVANGLGERARDNVLYGFDLRTNRLLVALKQQLQAEEVYNASR